MEVRSPAVAMGQVKVIVATRSFMGEGLGYPQISQCGSSN